MNRTALAACLVLTAGLAPTGPSLAVGGDHAKKPSVTVFGPDGSDQLTTFTTAKCGKERDGDFRARAVSTDKAWKMTLDIPNFKGYGRAYDIPLSTYDPDVAAVFIKPTHADSPVYASYHVPSFPVPGFGQVNFKKRGKLMGIGFGPAMWDERATSAITFAGVVTCRYKKKPR